MYYVTHISRLCLLNMAAEYEKIRKNGPQLLDAFKDHLGALSVNLLAVNLISDDHVSEVTNPAQSRPERASRLLELIRNKVKLSRANYYIFLGALMKDPQYEHILKIRK